MFLIVCQDPEIVYYTNQLEITLFTNRILIRLHYKNFQ